MFLLIMCGFILSKLGFFDEKTTGKLSAILTKFIIPASIIASFVRKFDVSEAKGFLSAFVIDMFFFIISAFLASIIFKRKEGTDFRDYRTCSIYVNNALFAFPLISALFGDYGIFIGSAHLCSMNIFLWTYGIFLYKGKEGISLKSAIINPGLIATLIGALILVSPTLIPDNAMNVLTTNGFTSQLGKCIFEALNMLKSANTPIAMLVAGAWLEKAGIKNSVADLSVWKVSLIRMIVFPSVLLGILYFLPVNNDIKNIILLGSSSPTAIIAATFSQINGSNYIFCVKAIAVTTLLSAITMPMFVALISLF